MRFNEVREIEDELSYSSQEYILPSENMDESAALSETEVEKKLKERLQYYKENPQEAPIVSEWATEV